MDKKEIAAETLQRLLSNPPPDVDLTLVGGGALILWIEHYREHYPGNFDSERIAGTEDIDFIALKVDVLKCEKHWGGVLYQPGFDHATPEIAILSVDAEGGEGSIEIDFLQDLLGIAKNESLKGRLPILGFSEKENIYFLSEFMVLKNRVMNTLSLYRYRRANAIDQIYNAMSVVKSAIMAKLDVGDNKGASRMAYKVLDMTRTRRIGIKLFVIFGIDLLDAVVINDERHVAGFTDMAQPKLLKQIYERRESNIKHQRRRGKSEQDWWQIT